MKRMALEKLLAWRDSPRRKPLILEGARQVGKTWLVKEFAKRAFADFAMVDFEDHRELRNMFESDFDVRRIISSLGIATGKKIEPGRTLLFLDEIQHAPRGVTALKYIREKLPELHVVAAGSLLGVALHKGESFPVGNVDFLRLFPMSFSEFLVATGDGQLAKSVVEKDWETIRPFENILVDRLKSYLFVGGMPEAVDVFVKTGDCRAVRAVHATLAMSYGNDFSKHIPPILLSRVRMVWDGLAGQLAKENRKFKYADLKKGGRAKDFEEAIEWLVAAGLAYKVARVGKPGIPISAYEDRSAFKLFCLDVGLMAAMAGLRAETILEGNRLFEEFKGSLTEQYVLQQLVSQEPDGIAYWTNDRSTAEVDFLVQTQDRVVPIEVKSGENLRAKSFKLFCETYKPEKAFRASLAFYRNQGWMENLPLWALVTNAFF